ncbi:c6 zinc finger domain-containing protein [Fusarium mexicanum]|uniref:C6 zinc finger domain-containing protein n=1 Tax=Fusarium mexicanum TaxID=751941 RepID=A0A8H5IPX3_9HYPO|nr:c6 zinc finger domain-containing protein [Fusarium mexicanum]
MSSMQEAENGQKCVVGSKKSGRPNKTIRLAPRDEEACSAENCRPDSPSYWLDLDQPEEKVTTRCPDLSTTDAYPTPETEIKFGVSPHGGSSISSSPQKDNFWSNPPTRIPRLSINDERELWRDAHVPMASRTRGCKAEYILPWVTGGFVLCPFYHFIQPLSLREADTEVAKLLEQRGCLHVPAKPILDEFMEKYFSYFHPLVPVLDEQTFWLSYGEESETNRNLSLFVLQAMLFVSSPYVSQETLIGLGFRTVQEAQDEFYIRATTLFNLQSTLGDQDRARGAMMLTYRTVSFVDKKPLYWLSIAIHYAKNVDAHLYHEKQGTRKGSLLKRLWWCCVLRDRILALALHQSPLVNPGAHETRCPALSVADFTHEIGTSRVYDHVDKQIIVRIAVVLCSFSDILGDILLLSPLGKGHTRAVAHTNLGCCFRSITENMIELKDTGLFQYLPITFISFSAAPLIWYLLQSHIQNSDSEAQRDLDVQFDVMNRFSHLYRNAESTINYIKSIVEHIKISLPLPTDDLYSDCAGGDGGGQSTFSDGSWSSKTWTDMPLRDPRRYLHVALAVEFSLARGRCPAEDDFPLWLRDHEPCLNSCSSRSGSDSDSVFFSEAVGDLAYGDQEAVCVMMHDGTHEM